MKNLYIGLLAGIGSSLLGYIYQDLPIVQVIPYAIGLISAKNPAIILACLLKISIEGYHQAFKLNENSRQDLQKQDMYAGIASGVLLLLGGRFDNGFSLGVTLMQEVKSVLQYNYIKYLN
ncbi:UNKNOWN [Stylonychia lemnae]|uniref:Uncharacterized protein n=1 Tax=Stylonychia lemnae TaxID=5949 RepID=A0A078A4J1_STYLE|nr:UNKNOWN [Stylonychia lemnae]|eukprot:CDW77173.1 UNKNOWN [Stylonychia lemnae]